MGIMFESGYIPIVKSNFGRYHSHLRRKARKIFYRDIIRYRQRGRGESPYGSLTNAYGDRLSTVLVEATFYEVA